MPSSGMLHRVTCMNRLFGRTFRLHYQGQLATEARCEEIHSIRSVLRLLTFFLGSRIIVTLMMEAIHPSETSVITRATWCYIPEDSTLHSHRRENLRFYIGHIDFLDSTFPG
jgi:hypothetical protein